MLSFQFSTLLWIGLPMALVPVLIHLINLVRHRRVRWAAMEFLLVSQRKNRTWVLLKELLLLLVRMLAIAGVVLLLAQPMLTRAWGRLLGSRTVHHVVLLDDSFSMSDRWGQTSAFDEARQAVLRLAEALGTEGEQTFTLVRFSQAGRAIRGTQPDLLQRRVDSEFLDDLRSKLAGLEASQSDAGPLEALRAVEQLLGKAEYAAQNVYLISDFRARQWEEPGDVVQALADLHRQGARLHLVHCVEAEHPNLAIEQLVPGPGTRAAGVPLFMEVTVRNFGAAAVKDVPVLVEADGQALPAVTVAEIPPRQAVKERFPVRFAEAGMHRIAVRLEADAVLADNARFAVVDFPPAVPVLLVDGGPRGDDARYLSAVFAVGGGVVTGLSPRIEAPRFLASEPLEAFRAVYLLNVGRLEKSAVAALERYVSAGGGVAFFLGDQTQADFINQELYRQGEGVFPVPLGQATDLVPDYLQKTPDLQVGGHPIFQVFAGARNTFLPLVMISRYFATAPGWKAESAKGVEILARLRNGAPLVVEKRWGQGRVVAFLTTAAPTWNNWARDNPSFPVAMLELQAFLAGGPPADTQRRVGAPLEVLLNPSQFEAQVQFEVPGQERLPSGTVEAIPTSGGQLVATLADTDLSGFYRARLLRKDGQEEQRQWAYNVEGAEGDLRTLTGEQLLARLKGVPCEYHPAKAFQYDRQHEAGYNLTDVFWYVLVGLLLGEQVLAYSASYHPSRRRPSMVIGRVR